VPVHICRLRRKTWHGQLRLRCEMLMLSALQQYLTSTFDERMRTMTEFPLRRAQIVAPSGAGSLQTSLDGITGVICGIDHWMDRTDDGFERTEFEIRDEWRLCEALGVNYFVRPPDHRATRLRRSTCISRSPPFASRCGTGADSARHSTFLKIGNTSRAKLFAEPVRRLTRRTPAMVKKKKST